jgi:hypothetical protein
MGMMIQAAHPLERIVRLRNVQRLAMPEARTIDGAGRQTFLTFPGLAHGSLLAALTTPRIIVNG